MPKKQPNLMGKEELLNIACHVEIRPMTSSKCMAGPPPPTPQRCSAGCSVNQQRILERCDSEIQSHPKP
ncbi:hypothetical protein TNCV_719741 [Trichonephila clavipes]|nr:hypothetical protein TNCV_719741 [Trichonephila clavipes]